MKSSNLAHLAGLATVLGAVLFVFFGLVFFVYTHGTTGVDRQGTLFGLDGTDYCRMQVAWPVLLAVGVFALRDRYFHRDGRLARLGLNMSLVALGMHALGIVLQCWLKDPHNAADFESIPLTLGFYLGSLSYLVLTAGKLMLGIAALRGNVLRRWSFLPLAIGLLVMPTVLFAQSTVSDGTPTWDLIYTASRLPLGLCWALLGYIVWNDKGETVESSV